MYARTHYRRDDHSGHSVPIPSCNAHVPAGAVRDGPAGAYQRRARPCRRACRRGLRASACVRACPSAGRADRRVGWAPVYGRHPRRRAKCLRRSALRAAGPRSAITWRHTKQHVEFMAGRRSKRKRSNTWARPRALSPPSSPPSGLMRPCGRVCPCLCVCIYVFNRCRGVWSRVPRPSANLQKDATTRNYLSQHVVGCFPLVLHDFLG